ncbi:MAG: flagellar basal body rod protein FlgC [Azospirillaceae bacterium]|nr:flagellar basal body rod protein FlgC [Azospirillaceae bacterium]
MDLYKSMDISASGMKAETARIRVISENIANSESTATSPNELPYRRKTITFRDTLDRKLGVDVVKADHVGYDPSQFETRYDPGNPGADAQGYVKLPNVNVLIENVDLKQAQRSYQANLNVLSAAKSMISKTLDLLKS